MYICIFRKILSKIKLKAILQSHFTAAVVRNWLLILIDEVKSTSGFYNPPHFYLFHLFQKVDMLLTYIYRSTFSIFQKSQFEFR